MLTSSLMSQEAMAVICFRFLNIGGIIELCVSTFFTFYFLECFRCRTPISCWEQPIYEVVLRSRFGTMATRLFEIEQQCWVYPVTRGSSGIPDKKLSNFDLNSRRLQFVELRRALGRQLKSLAPWTARLLSRIFCIALGVLFTSGNAIVLPFLSWSFNIPPLSPWWMEGTKLSNIFQT